MRKVRYAPHVLTVLCSLLVGLLIVEVGLRLFFRITHRDIHLYQPSTAYNATLPDARRFVAHPFLPYAQRPNDSRTLLIYRPETQQTYAYSYNLNSLGFRTPERPFKKPAGVKRLVVLGGSTANDGFTDAETWPARLETKLNAAEFRVEVINLAMDMAASPTSLIDLEFIGLEYEPDVVISYDGVNDVSLIGRPVAPDYRNALADYDEAYLLQGVLPAWTFRSYLVSVLSRRIDQFRGADIGTRISRVNQLPPAEPLTGIEHFERNLKLMRAAANEYHARFIAATAHWVTPDEKVRRINEELRTFYTREGINYLDLDASLPHGDWSLHVDQVHWTRAGIERVADLWAPKIGIERLLDRPEGR